MRSRRIDERGASLLMVIIFVMVFGVIAGAVLDFANTGFKTTTAIANVRNDQNRFEGATEGAINAVRGSSKVGYSGVACPTFVQDNVFVTCSSAGPSTGTSTDAFPKDAILALGTGAEGVVVTAGNLDFTIDGGVHSNGVVDAGSQPKNFMRVFGDLTASGSCTPAGNYTATGLTQCSLGSGGNRADPNYPSAVASIAGLPAVDPAAACVGGLVKFFPGLYSETPSVFVPPGCNGSWWFSPGTYYFDFNTAWAIGSGKTVIGGTLNGASNGCNPGTEAAPNIGVQFIFGGSTRLTLGSGSTLSLCAGTSATTSQRIAFYGLKSGTRSTSTNTTLSAPTSVIDGGFLPANGIAAANDGIVSNVTLNGDGQNSATLVATAFGKVPAGATVTKVLVDVRHAETGAAGSKVKPQVTVTYGSGSQNYPLTQRSSMTTDTVDVTAQLSPTYRYRDVNTIGMTYTADGSTLNKTVCNGNGSKCTASESALASLDVLAVRVDYTAPGFEAHTCPSNCAILDATGQNAVTLLSGTFYAPTARLDVLAHNNGIVGFVRGIVARTVNITISASSKQTTSPFSLPGQAGARTVVFEAHDGSAAGPARLRASVSFDDTSSLPGKGVTVLKWVVLR